MPNTTKLRTYAGKIMAETYGDSLRNEIASAFIETARQLEKCRKMESKNVYWSSFLLALGGSLCGSAITLLITSLLK